ncbi:MAG: response regulator [bacterium]
MSSSVTPTSTPIAGSNPWACKKVVTTGEAAELCKISQQTIIRCFDAGRLGGFRVPGSRFRRIPRADLIHFMQSNQIPTGLLDVPECKRILAVDDDPRIIELMMDTIGRDRRFDLRTASTGFDAGMLVESFKPHLVLLDYLLPDINGQHVISRIRGNLALAGTRIIVISGAIKQADVDTLLASGADEYIKKPFDAAHLAERIDAILST